MGCYNSAVINAPADKVWSALREFHDLSWSANVVQSVDSEGDPSQPGAKRVLNGVFHETLVEIDDEQRIQRYSIDDGPDAVSKDNVEGYVGRIQVFPVTANDTSFVVWASSWKTSGGGVQEFCDPIYRALLSDLQQHFG